MAHDDIISRLPQIDELRDRPLEGVSNEILRKLLEGDSVDGPEAAFQSSISP